MSDYLEHFNPYHDALGRFAKATIGAASKGAKVANDIERQKQIAKNVAVGAAVAAGTIAVLGGVYAYKKNQGTNYGISRVISTEPLNSMLDSYSSDNAVTLDAGTIFQRISDKAIEDYTSRGETYVSYLFGDNAKYKDRMPRESWIGGRENTFVHKITAGKPIKAPSSRECAEIFLKCEPKARQVDYINFMTSGIRNPKAYYRKPFVDELHRRGFNAVPDENDGGGIRPFSRSPLILIDPSELISGSKSHKLSRAESVIATYFK